MFDLNLQNHQLVPQLLVLPSTLTKKVLAPSFLLLPSTQPLLDNPISSCPAGTGISCQLSLIEKNIKTATYKQFVINFSQITIAQPRRSQNLTFLCFCTKLCITTPMVHIISLFVKSGLQGDTIVPSRFSSMHFPQLSTNITHPSALWSKITCCKYVNALFLKRDRTISATYYSALFSPFLSPRRH